MFQSKVIQSPQDTPHRRLAETINRHKDSEYKKPYQQHNLNAFASLEAVIDGAKSIILDSCCGTGMSTALIAKSHPDSLVIGIDRSEHRLERKDNALFSKPDNCFYFRANCEDLWRLCAENNITFEAHYILYPNPYPKAEHLKKRWHGHPVFPVLPQLSAKTILRSNWRLYLEEFALAWSQITNEPQVAIKELTPTRPLTLFERKYHASAQELFEITCLTKT